MVGFGLGFRFRIWVSVGLGLGLASRTGWVGTWPATRLDPTRTHCLPTPRKYVFDVTSIGQRSSRRVNSVKVEINFTSSASSIFLVHNLYCDKCI